ncbi:MAG: RICIN domain-containing protein, partial [Coriobacteriales bacterium]|nr:RICIN domain-containing protein [Coriobacteriales bacterium]
KLSGHALDIYGGAAYSGASVVQWTHHGADNQKWALKLLSEPDALDDFVVSILSKQGNYSFDVWGASDTQGASITTYPYHGGANQQFKLVRVVSDTPESTEASADEDTLLNNQSSANGTESDASLDALSLLGQAPNTGASLVPGTYTIKPKSSFFRVLDVWGASSADGAAVVQYDYSGSSNQRFVVSQDEQGFYTFTHEGADKVLDVWGASTLPGTPVLQYTRHEAVNQKWYVTQGEPNGPYAIHSALGLQSGAGGVDLSLDIWGGGDTNAAALTIYQHHDGANQQFEFLEVGTSPDLIDQSINAQISPSTYYRLVPACAPYNTLDIWGGYATPGSALTSFSTTPDTGALNQLFYFETDQDGYYTIRSVNSTLALDIYGGSAYSGASVVQWTAHNGDNQKWAVRLAPGHNLNEQQLTVSILSKKGYLSLDIWGASTAAGAKATTYSYHGAANQQFTLVPVQDLPSAPVLQQGVIYNIVSNTNASFVLDINGASVSPGATVVGYQSHGGFNQIFTAEAVPSSPSTYILKGYSSQLPLADSGGTVIQASYTGGTDQQWRYIPGVGGYKLQNVATQGYMTFSAAQSMTQLVTQANAPNSLQGFHFIKATLPIKNGIDVSSWQPADIGWWVDYDFMIVKATGGSWYKNPNMEAQANAALARGKKLGLYHYAIEPTRASNNSAIAEANWFIDNVGSYLGNAVLFLDYEEELPGYDRDWITQFCQHIKARTGISCQIYTSGSWANNYISGLWDNLGVWLWQANYWYSYTPFYGYNTGITPMVDCKIYQYTSSGYLPGYGSALDLNVFYGTYDDWYYKQHN